MTISVENKQSRREKASLRVLLLHLSYFTWKSDELKKSTEFLVNARYENEWKGQKINSLPSGWLICRLIMFLAERLSSEFICPWSFDSRPTFRFSDNLSDADIVNGRTSRLKGFVYWLIHHTQENIISFHTSRKNFFPLLNFAIT